MNCDGYMALVAAIALWAGLLTGGTCTYLVFRKVVLLRDAPLRQPKPTKGAR